MEQFGKFCFGVCAIIINTLLVGYAFMKLWQWFIVYAFAVQPISLIQSIGIVFFWGYIKPKKKDEGEFNFEKFTTDFIEGLVLFVITLGLGYLITLFQ